MKAQRAGDKAGSYEQLAGLLDAGIPISRAVVLLRDRMGGAAGAALGRCARRMSEGETLSAAMAGDPVAWAGFESAVVAAGEEAGRLVPLVRELARYWRMMDETRRRVIAGLIYPLLILHVAILAGNVPVAVAGGAGAYAKVVAIWLLVVYAAAWFAWEAAGSGPGMGLLRRLPIVGGAMSALGRLRFALCLRLQVEAGIPILTALPRAAQASGGAALGARARRAADRLGEGEPIAGVMAELFAGDAALPAMIATGVESGRIVETLKVVEAEASARWEEAMALLQVWLPRAVYFLAMAVAVWQIARLAAGIYGAYGEAASIEW